MTYPFFFKVCFSPPFTLLFKKKKKTCHQGAKKKTCSVMPEQIAYIPPIQSIILAFSDTLPSLQMVTKIHLDLIESSVKAHGCLEVVRIII